MLTSLAKRMSLVLDGVRRASQYPSERLVPPVPRFTNGVDSRLRKMFRTGIRG
jgi:hypothetical protein